MNEKFFDITSTGLPLYDLMIQNPKYFLEKKYMSGKIVFMSPDQYIKTASECLGTTVKRFVSEIDEELVSRYAEKMSEGIKFDMPSIECQRGNQEGRHRVLAAKKIGIDKIPVFVVEHI